MLRRDQFIKKISELNSGDYLNQKLIDLEAFVDDQLIKDSIITKMINTNLQGIVDTTSGIEVVLTIEPTEAVHQDVNVKGGNSGTAGSASGRKIWNDALTYENGNSATTMPWNDLRLEDTNFTGSVDIELPENTNKNVAMMLVNKYNSTQITGSIPIGGFWKIFGQNTVSLTWDPNKNKLYMTFKLF